MNMLHIRPTKVASAGSLFGLGFMILFGIGFAILVGNVLVANEAPAAAIGLFALFMLGFCIKAGVFPLQFWLPPAHAAAPSHVSSFMSGVFIKMGILGMVRMLTWVPDPPLWWGGLLVLLGALAMALGPSLVACHQAEVDDGRGLERALLTGLGASLLMNLAALDLFLPSTAFFFILALAHVATRRLPARGLMAQAEPYAGFLMSAGLFILAAFITGQALGLPQSSLFLRRAEALANAGKTKLPGSNTHVPGRCIGYLIYR